MRRPYSMRLVNDCLDRVILRTAILAAQHDVTDNPVSSWERRHLIRGTALQAMRLRARVRGRKVCGHAIGRRGTARHCQRGRQHGELGVK